MKYNLFKKTTIGSTQTARNKYENLCRYYVGGNVNDRSEETDGMGIGRKQNHISSSELDKRIQSGSWNRTRRNSDPERNTDNGSKANDGNEIRGNSNGPENASGKDYERKREIVTRELRSLALALDTGEAILIEAKGGEIKTRGAGKHAPESTGVWGLSIAYRRGMKK